MSALTRAQLLSQHCASTPEAAVLVTGGHGAEQLTVQPSVRTDLPQHVRCDGKRGPDGRVDTEEHQPQQHASPDGQVTELSRSR